MPPSRLSRPGLVYVSGVIAAGSFAVAASVYEMYTAPVGYQWFILAALTVLSGSATVKLPSVPASLSVSETFVFTSVLLFGAPAGTLTVALDGLIISLWLNKRRKEVHRVLFNMAAPALSIWVAAQLFFLLSGLPPLAQAAAMPGGLADFMVPLGVFTIVFFLLNSWLITFAVAFETGEPPLHIWRTNFLWLSLNFFCGASVAALLTLPALRARHLPTGFDDTLASRPIDLTDFTYLGAIIPLLLVLYVTYRTTMARVADANEHLDQMNGMYISTIEALAMAVDAKDQVTHGHIRRVQHYTIGLARALGISDGGLFRAIEAASLLHDMGKLAVPEHILNKPGKLTTAEFDRMKLHAAVGADILASIRFPYPVIPIVRHHHENWDGSGYPDGLKGTDIPLGARILAVVDCFDALTSDRPYRRRLSDSEATAILLHRRGGMYDPLVIDTFLKVLPALRLSESGSAPSDDQNDLIELTRTIARNQAAIVSPRVDEAGLESIRRAVTLARSIATTGRRLGCDERLTLAATQVFRALSPGLLIVFRYVVESDTLKARLIFGSEDSALYELSMMRGEKLSGWVAAHKMSVNNAGAALDLTDELRGDLTSALSVPLMLGDLTMGALTLYSSEIDRFRQEDQRLCEILAPYMAEILSEEVVGARHHTLTVAAARIAADGR
jgi:putative nucleotidyltransferase with HDIG domain